MILLLQALLVDFVAAGFEFSLACRLLGLRLPLSRPRGIARFAGAPRSWRSAFVTSSVSRRQARSSRMWRELQSGLRWPAAWAPRARAHSVSPDGVAGQAGLAQDTSRRFPLDRLAARAVARAADGMRCRGRACLYLAFHDSRWRGPARRPVAAAAHAVCRGGFRRRQMGTCRGTCGGFRPFAPASWTVAPPGIRGADAGWRGPGPAAGCSGDIPQHAGGRSG